MPRGQGQLENLGPGGLIQAAAAQFGLAGISTVVTSVAVRSAGPLGAALPDALTAGFRAGFTVSAALTGLAALTALALLREDGRGQRVNLVELQAGPGG